MAEPDRAGAAELEAADGMIGATLGPILAAGARLR
jgi:hypothetical protein